MRFQKSVLGHVSRKSWKRFWTEKPFVKLRLAYSMKLVFSYFVKRIKIKKWLQILVHRDAFILKIQRALCHSKCARKVSGLSRNELLSFLGSCNENHWNMEVAGVVRGSWRTCNQTSKTHFWYLKDIFHVPRWLHWSPSAPNGCQIFWVGSDVLILANFTSFDVTFTSAVRQNLAECSLRKLQPAIK